MLEQQGTERHSTRGGLVYTQPGAPPGEDARRTQKRAVSQTGGQLTGVALSPSLHARVSVLPRQCTPRTKLDAARNACEAAELRLAAVAHSVLYLYARQAPQELV